MQRPPTLRLHHTEISIDEAEDSFVQHYLVRGDMHAEKCLNNCFYHEVKEPRCRVWITGYIDRVGRMD